MRTVTYSSLVVVVVGFLLCLVMLLTDGAISCAGSGCSLYADMGFLGLSFHVWGVMLFVLLIFTWGKTWHAFISLLALLADIPFLAWQAIFVPCTTCLTVSVLLTLNASLARAPARAGRPWWAATFRRLAIITACALICFNAINILKEKPPWGLNGRPASDRQLFFSPSCEPCREHIRAMFTNGSLRDVALIPIALSESDSLAITAMADAYRQRGYPGLLAALDGGGASTGSGGMGVIESFQLTVLLHWNYMHLVRAGGSAVPWFTGPPGSARADMTVEPDGRNGCGATPGLCAPAQGEGIW